MPRDNRPSSSGKGRRGASRGSSNRNSGPRKTARGEGTKSSANNRTEKSDSKDFRKGRTASSKTGDRSTPPSKSRFSTDRTRKTGGRRSDTDSFEKRPSRQKPAGRKSFFEKKKEGAPKGKPYEISEAPAQTEKIRLNRFIANSGVCSRREADQLISMGLIAVNGKTVTELGYKVNPGDEVRYENKILRAEKPVYILMNKPKGYLTTTDDPQERNTIMHIIGNAVKERIYPVGRLDRNTTGLLLLTNDGELADKLMHPSYNVKKIYKVELDRPLSRTDAEKILSGVMLEEGRAVVDDLAILDDGKTVGLELHIGWNRVVRRIFEALNYEVIKLDRSVYAGLDKKDLSRGQWRFLTREEIVRLKHFK
jgi:23S rRNA pseudouridine2605 synthase